MSALRPITLRWAGPSRLRRAVKRNCLGRIHRSRLEQLGGVGGKREEQGGRSRSLLQASLLRPSDRLRPGVAPRGPAPPRLDQSASSVDEPGLSNPNSCLLFFLRLPPSSSSSSSSLFILSAAEKNSPNRRGGFYFKCFPFPVSIFPPIIRSGGGNASPPLRTNSSTRRFRRSANRHLTDGDTVVCLAFRRR